MLCKKLSTEDGTTKMCNECLAVVNNADSVIIFGAGVGGRQLFDFLVENNLQHKVGAFSDNNTLKFYNSFRGVNIIPPYELYKKYPFSTIIIASSAYLQIKAQLLREGYSDNKIVLFNFAFSDLKYSDKDYIYDNICDFEKAFMLLEDDKSRDIFINILNYKISKLDKYLVELQKVVDDEVYQYFDFDLYHPSDNEIIVDVGAFTGDTLDCFVNKHKCKYKKYICFEADPNTYLELKKNINQNGWLNIEAYNIGLWNKKGILKLSVENSGSSGIAEIEDKNLRSIHADTLDNILIDGSVTLIKMDIEGAEFNALCGMQETIIKNKPILAISVYHKRDDYFKLLGYIDALLPGEYKYYFRQYRYTPTETVCYAIPKHRRI